MSMYNTFAYLSDSASDSESESSAVNRKRGATAAAAAGNSLWEEVHDKRKEKRTERKAKKDEQAKHYRDLDEERRRTEAAFRSSHSNSSQSQSHSSLRSTKSAKKVGVIEEFVINDGKDKKSQRLEALKKRKRSKKPVTFSIASESDVVQALIAVLKSSENASSSLSIAALGEKFTTLTKHSWNKSLRPRYGVLSSFLSSHSDLFTVNGDSVALASEVLAEGDANLRAKEAAKESAIQILKEKEERRQLKRKLREQNGQHIQHQETENALHEYKEQHSEQEEQEEDEEEEEDDDDHDGESESAEDEHTHLSSSSSSSSSKVSSKKSSSSASKSSLMSRLVIVLFILFLCVASLVSIARGHENPLIHFFEVVARNMKAFLSNSSQKQ